MKLYYITTSEKIKEIRRTCHWLEVENGKFFVCIDWKEEQEEYLWANHPDVLPLPHPIFEAATPLSVEHIKHLGPRLGVQPGHNVHHAIRAAVKEDFWMRLHVL